MPIVSGTMRRPAFVPEYPSTTWKKVGMYTITANMPKPMRKPSVLATATVRERNRRNGRSGSRERASTTRNSARPSAPATASARMNGEPHAYSLPPHTVTSMSAPVAPTTRSAPR
jgi:hypothetical protein